MGLVQSEPEPGKTGPIQGWLVQSELRTRQKQDACCIQKPRAQDTNLTNCGANKITFFII